MSDRQRTRLLVCMVIALGSALVVSLAQASGYLRPVQFALTDSFYRLQDFQRFSDYEANARQQIVIVAIDDATLARLGRWTSWDRSLYARVTEELTRANSRTIAFDVGFFEAAPGDSALRAALAEAEAIVLPIAGSGWARDLSGQGPRALASVERTLPDLISTKTAIGSANVLADDDGTVRRLPLIVRAGDELVPALGFAAAAEHLRQSIDLQQPADNFRFGGRTIALSPRYEMLVNYVGGPSQVRNPDEQVFPIVSFADVLEGDFDRAQFANKLVLVGLLGATGFADDYWTPVSNTRLGKMFGVEIHANAAATLMRAAFLTPLAADWSTVLVVVLALFGGVLTARFSPVPAGLGALGIGLGFLVVAWLAFRFGQLWSVAYPLLALGLSYAGGAAYTVTVDQRQSRFLRGAMGRYLSPAVLDELVRHPEHLQLGGEKRVMTVLFSDIRGFTSFAEQLDPHAVVALLNEYLSAMTEVIYRHDGVLDKYMGDAIMAFWNGPLDQPDHARRACLAALDMLAELQTLQERWRERGVPALHMGIGLNTGEMYVGNMGSDRRFDYTVIGDAVNLGSRLEALNKEYGTSAILSAATLEAVDEVGFVVRYLDRVAVKGKLLATPIYELLGPAGVSDSLTPELLALYERGTALYQQRAFDEAAAAFRVVLAARPSDRPSAIYLERCEELRAAPPPVDWDGVFVMSHK